MGVAGATPFGQITEFSSGFSPGAVVNSVTPGPDGNLWFIDSGTKAIGVFNPVTHEVSEFNSGLNPGSAPNSVVAGSDGNIWFTDRGTTKAIGMINPTTHAISEFSSGLNPGSLPNIPTFGPDGNTWFSDGGTVKAIGRINVVTHTITEFSSGLSSTGPSRPIAGPDGNLWFVDKSVTAPAVGRITPTGVITEFPVTGLSPGQFLNSANFGPGGVFWIGSEARLDCNQHRPHTSRDTLGSAQSPGFGSAVTQLAAARLERGACLLVSVTELTLQEPGVPA